MSRRHIEKKPPAAAAWRGLALTGARALNVVQGMVLVWLLILGVVIVAMLGPSVTSVIISIAVTHWTTPARLVRAEMLEVLRTDYIKFARARGLSNRAINFGHALKNTLVPVITITGLQLGSIIAFSIITETVFQWPGVGSLFINSVQVVDVQVHARQRGIVARAGAVVGLAQAIGGGHIGLQGGFDETVQQLIEARHLLAGQHVYGG